MAFAVPPSKLFLIGLDGVGRLSAFERTFNKCMGPASPGPDTIYLGTRYQIWSAAAIRSRCPSRRWETHVGVVSDRSPDTDLQQPGLGWEHEDRDHVRR